MFLVYLTKQQLQYLFFSVKRCHLINRAAAAANAARRQNPPSPLTPIVLIYAKPAARVVVIYGRPKASVVVIYEVRQPKHYILCLGQCK